MGEHLPAKVWLRVAGGGVTMPSGRAYTTMVGDDRDQPRHVEYVRGDIADALVKSLEEIREMLWARPDVVAKLRPLMGFAENQIADRATAALLLARGSAGE